MCAPLSWAGPALMASLSATNRIWSSVTLSPALPAILPTVTSAPSSTRYCFPPLRTTAYTASDLSEQKKSPHRPCDVMKSIPVEAGGGRLRDRETAAEQLVVSGVVLRLPRGLRGHRCRRWALGTHMQGRGVK